MAKLLTVKYFVLQYRRQTRIAWQTVDGLWHDRGEPIHDASVAESILAAVIRKPGAGLFEWRLSTRHKVISKAIA